MLIKNVGLIRALMEQYPILRETVDVLDLRGGREGYGGVGRRGRAPGLDSAHAEREALMRKHVNNPAVTIEPLLTRGVACPFCSRAFKTVAHVDRPFAPGRMCLCPQCNEISEVGIDGKLIRPSDDALLRVKPAALKAARILVTLMKRKRGARSYGPWKQEYIDLIMESKCAPRPAEAP